MNKSANRHERRRFPPAITQYAVWNRRRVNRCRRYPEDLVAERGLDVSYGWACHEAGKKG